MQRVTNLSSSVENLRIRSDLNEAELEYRRESFNASHSVFVVESKMLDEEIATLRRALARAETKVQACDLERELNGGKETPLAAEASSKAAAAWKVLMARLIRHNTTAKFLNKLAPDTPVPSTEEQGHGAGATAPAARGERARLAGVSENAQAAAAHEAAVKNQVLDGLNEALRKLNADQAAEKKLHKVVASGRLRLRELHLQLAQASMLTQLVKGKDVKGRMPFDLDDLVQHRGRLGEERSEVHRFVRDLRVPDKTYRQQVDDLDSKIARLKRQARLKKAATSSTIVHSSGAGHWGRAYFVGAQTQRPHWY